MSSDEERIAQLLALCKSADADTRVDALGKLQVECEKGIDLSNSEAFLNTLKTCLRTSNIQLSTAAISTIHSYLSLFQSNHSSSSPPDLSLLRQLVVAFLPSGGVIDRLGESREKTREKARDVLLMIGTMCQQWGGTTSHGILKGKDTLKGVETPLMLFERLLREVGMASKVWRVREQTILVIVHIRRTLPAFPLRPFLNPLVQALQDPDGTVRECSRKSVIEVFKGPGVTDAARADLKREMEKLGVRKSIRDEVLSSVLATDTQRHAEIPETQIPLPLSRLPTADVIISRSVSPAASQELISNDTPTATPSLEVDISPVYVASSKDLEHEFSVMGPYFQGKETEHNWADRERSIHRLRGMLRGDVYGRYGETFLAGLKNGLLDGTYKALFSLRTTVASQTCSLYIEMAKALGTAIDPFVESLLSHLLRMAGFTKKLIATQSQAAVTYILRNTSCQPRTVVSLLWSIAQEKTAQSRSFAIAHVHAFIETHGIRSKHSIEASGALETLEKCIRRALADANPIVRDPARVCFWVFYAIWKDRGSAIMDALDAPGKKQLEKVCPEPNLVAGMSHPPAESKKSSVAAAIAASRAKAKQIAAAPPTLRHQATSSYFSHGVAHNTSNGQRATSPATSPRVSRMSPPTKVSSSVADTPRQRRTPSTTTLPLSREGSIRSTPSPPLSQSSVQSSKMRPASPRLSASPPSKSAISHSPPGRSRLLPGHSRLGSSSSSKSPIMLGITAQFQSQNTPIHPSQSISPAASLSHGSDDHEQSINLMSFSTPISKPPASNTSYTGGIAPLQDPDPAIEEELRATSAQAEAAAEQLLDLSRLAPDVGELATHEASELNVLSVERDVTPKTPQNRVGLGSQVWQHIRAFETSPMPGNSPEAFTILKDPKHHTSWWLKAKAMIEGMDSLSYTGREGTIHELHRCIDMLDQGVAQIRELRNLIGICRENPATIAPRSSTPMNSGALQPYHENPVASGVSNSTDFWTDNDLFEKLLQSVIRFLTNNKDPLWLQLGMVLLWEIVQYQYPHLNGHEMELYQVLFSVRHSGDKTILEASNALRDALGVRIDPVYGLTTVHECLKQFLLDPGAFPSPSLKFSTHVFGLIAVGKFVIRLPPEILEEELPRLRMTFLKGLEHENSVVRLAASMDVVACQVVLQDETHLFALLDGLSEEKKNFLTYLFNKNEVDVSLGGLGADRLPALQKVETEMGKLDARLHPR